MICSQEPAIYVESPENAILSFLIGENTKAVGIEVDAKGDIFV